MTESRIGMILTGDSSSRGVGSGGLKAAVELQEDFHPPPPGPTLASATHGHKRSWWGGVAEITDSFMLLRLHGHFGVFILPG